VVVKADARREVYDQEKLKRSLQIACKKRPIATSSVDAIVSRIEGLLRDRFHEEVPSREIGEIVINELRSLDEVAYVRFASVYRNFQDKEEFITELEGLGEEGKAVQ
jgi:transcriptional repressor NrdR